MKHRNAPLIAVLTLITILILSVRADTPVPAPEAPPATNEAPAAEAALQTSILSRIDAGELDDALAMTEAALADAPEDTALLHLKGRILRLSGKNAAAIAFYRKRVTETPGDLQARHILGLLLHEQANAAEPSTRRELLAEAVSILDGEPMLLETYVAACVEAEAWQDAVSAFESAALAAPSEALLSDIAQAYREAGEKDKAIAAYAVLIGRGALDTKALVAHFSWIKTHGSMQDRLETVAAGLKHAPENPVLLTESGRLSIASGRPLDALAALAKVVELQPDAADLAALRAEMLLDSGGIALAKQAVDAQPDAFPPALRNRIAEAHAERQAARKAALAATSLQFGQSGIDNLTVLAYRGDALSLRKGDGLVDAATLIAQLDFLVDQGCRFVSTRTVAAAARGEVALAENSVLLSFDHGSAVFPDVALPVLEAYGAPALLAIGTANIGGGSNPQTANDLTWDTVEQLGNHPLIVVASLGHHLGNYVQANPQGKLAPAATTRRYDPEAESYEDEAAYAARVRGDLATAMQLLRSRKISTGDELVWPRGYCNAILLDQANDIGFELMFGTMETPRAFWPNIIRRQPVTASGDGIGALVSALTDPAATEITGATFGLPMSLDVVYDPKSEAKTRERLDKVVAMVKETGVTTVYLDGYSDLDGNGAAEAAYFPTDILPVRADLLSHAVSRLQFAGAEVFVRLPVLGLALPGEWRNPVNYVQEFRWGRLSPQNESQPRITPYDTEHRAKIVKLYADLAAYVPVDGIVLGGDAFLTESEDFSDAAAYSNVRRMKLRERNPERFTKDERTQWEALKYEQLDTLMDAIIVPIRRYKPNTMIVRTLMATAVGNDGARTYLSQSYTDAMARFDRVLIDVNAQPADTVSVANWIESLIQRARTVDGAMERLIFRIELRDPRSGSWISRFSWEGRAKDVARFGGRHFTFGPYASGPADKNGAIAKTWKDVRKVVEKVEAQ